MDCCHLSWLRRAKVVVVAFVVACHEAALGQTTLGERHRMDVVISAEPDAPILERLRGAKGSLSLIVRLSANSKESRFFGMLHSSYSEIPVPDRADEPLVGQTKLWEEAACHQRRGLPKATVTKLSGEFGEGEHRIDISAINRHIGLLIPADELITGIKLDPGNDEVGSFYAFRAQTRNSRLNVDLKIYRIDCFY